MPSPIASPAGRRRRGVTSRRRVALPRGAVRSRRQWASPLPMHSTSGSMQQVERPAKTLALALILDPASRMHQLGIRRECNRLLLHGRVDNYLPEVRGLGGSHAGRDGQCMCLRIANPAINRVGSGGRPSALPYKNVLAASGHPNRSHRSVRIAATSHGVIAGGWLLLEARGPIGSASPRCEKEKQPWSSMSDWISLWKRPAFASLSSPEPVVFKGNVASNPQAIAKLLRRRAPQASRIAFETGSLSNWLWHELKATRVPRSVPRRSPRQGGLVDAHEQVRPATTRAASPRWRVWAGTERQRSKASRA